jgi:DNA-binding MarR family transcriptional regulator
MESSAMMLAHCACARVRNASRVITRVYDEFLRDSGLKASQLAVLAAVDALELASITELSKTLLMDRTTLSRNLKPLIAQGFVTLGEEGWRRSKTIQIASPGQAVLKAALPLWQQAQEDLVRRLGAKRWKHMHGELQALIAAY